ncbi:restriction endonuclease subunit S [Sphingobacterium paludis]|uniref:Type I restriction enzyme S subunit n=1 Tax=Sphingobacterium paludis TaxID=1476465 RepID=A0A4R7CTI6_9SPHI|nr:restriction endonuclease subunit S [Sphingobacterium paludis]TDS11719.1 type I restriction enzyme S subunit [Sphingobacterium paludis]
MRMLNIDKSNWKKVSLSDVIYKTENNDKLNAKNLFKKFIKAEHLDAESLNIKNFGDQDNDELPPTFYKIFKSGQILYPTRNPHLRRAALAHFNGICGEKTLTLSVNEDVGDYRFIAFLFHSNSFYTHTTNCIVGSTNPHVRWRDVASYELLLPPKEQQAELADLLWAMDEVIEKDLSLMEKYKAYYFKSINELTSRRNQYCNKEYVLSSLGETYNGLNGKTKGDFGEGERYINYLNVYKNFEIDENEYDLVKISGSEKQNQVRFGDIIFTGSSETPDEVGITAVVLKDLKNYYLNSFCFGFRLFDFKKLDPRYAKFLFRNSEIRHFLNLRAQGSTRFNLSKTDLKNKLTLFLPDIDKQTEIFNHLNDLESNISLLRSKLTSSKTLQKTLINQIF